MSDVYDVWIDGSVRGHGRHLRATGLSCADGPFCCRRVNDCAVTTDLLSGLRCHITIPAHERRTHRPGRPGTDRLARHRRRRCSTSTSSTPTRPRQQGAQVICFQELFYGPYFCQVQETEYYGYTEHIPDGPDHRAVPGRRQGARHGDGAADVRDRAAGPVLQHRGGHRRRRHLPRQVPQAAHPADQGLLGEVLLQARHRRVSGVRHRGRQGRRVHLLRPPLPRRLAGARPERRRDRVQPVGHPPRAQRVPVAASSSRRPPSPTSTTSVRSTGSASKSSARTTSTGRATSSIRRASSSATSAMRSSPS